MAAGNERSLLLTQKAGAHSVWRATGPAPAAGAAAGLVLDLAVGQGLLQFGDARVGDLGFVEAEISQVGQLHKMNQPGVGDLGPAEPEHLQFG